MVVPSFIVFTWMTEEPTFTGMSRMTPLMVERMSVDDALALAFDSCAAQCPVEAISEGDGKFEIDADKCVSCGSCAGQCPVGAIEEA